MRNELSILIWMASPADMGVVSRLLEQAGLAFRFCAHIDCLIAEAGKGGGALLLEEEALTAPSALSRLNELIEKQPPWSEIPVVLLVRKSSAGNRKPWPRLIRNLTLVERPIASASLLSILQAALQSRRRQYEVRDLVASLRDLNANLERRVAQRTARLAQRAAELERLATELKRSNQELEDFAYVASHDLQEPLRMVASYVQLLENRYRNQLDDKAVEYIDFAVEGAERMQKLIEGLLAYSRIERRGEDFKAVPMNVAFSRTLAHLAAAIGESGAVVTRDDLPVIAGDEVQLIQLLQNLISNAIKYRRPETPPQVHVSCRREEGEWVFAVRDNGIGIEPQYFERIFQIFQRLHTRKQYPGNGIGLTLCRRIVERHDGRIWVESTPGQGTQFFFTIPIKPEEDHAH